MAKRKSKSMVPKTMNSAERTDFESGIIDDKVRNSMSVIMDALGIGFAQSGGQPLNQTNTLVINTRNYLISNMRQLLSEIYIEHGLVQTIVDLPVDDGLRGGIDIFSKQLGEDQVKELSIYIDRNNIVPNYGRGVKWQRLFGGAGIIIATDQDPATPIQVERITKDSPLDFIPVDMWELFSNMINTANRAKDIDQRLAIKKGEMYDYYGHKVDQSRVLKLVGLEAPSFVRPKLRGWGFSVVEALVNSINQYLKANNLIFEVLDEFKVDVYKIKNFTNGLLSKQGAEQVHKRIQVANMQKNYQHAITMDGEDDFIQKELSFTGVAETMAGIRMQIASDMRMPLTKVFGISAAGFNSGEDDIENYNAMVESQVRQHGKQNLLRIVELLCQKLFGFVPDDLDIEFKPLRMLSAEQEENVKTQKFNRLLQAKTSGLMSTKEFKDALNKDNLLGIQLDTSLEVLSDDSGDSEDGDEKEEIPAAPSAKSTLTAKEVPKTKNTLGFDRAEFETEQGGMPVPRWKKRLYDTGVVSDKALWAKSKEASKATFGVDTWEFTVWFYEKYGGKFK